MFHPTVDGVRARCPAGRRFRLRGPAAVATTIALTLIGAADAAGDVRVGGGAYAFSGDLNALLIPLSAGGLPAVTLPTEGGGPFTESLLSANVVGLAPISVAEVSTRGNSGLGRAASWASVAGVGLAGLVSVTAVRSSCSATADGADGTATVVDLVVAGIPISTVDAGPNTVIALPFGTVTVNQQVRSAGALTVNGLHVNLDAAVVGGDITLAQSRCVVKSNAPARARTALRRAHERARSS